MRAASGDVDLHIHSSFSDGELAPTELVRRAKAMNLRAVALTDHDNIGGVVEAVETGFEEGVEVIAGVELSVEYREFKDIHLLGYYVDWQSAPIGEKLRNFQEVRESRGERILKRINDHLMRQGMEGIDFAEVRARARGSVGRPHIAQELVEHGLAEGINDAFDRYLVPHNVPKAYFTPAEAVEMIGAARGVVVLAHPMIIAKDRGVLERVVVEFKELGILGLEVYYGDSTRPDISLCRELAREHGLVVTGGSDFHGEGFHFRLGRLRDGRPIPYQVVLDLRRAYFARYPVMIGIAGLGPALGARLVQEAALQIEAEALPDGLAAAIQSGGPLRKARRSVVTWLAEGGTRDERSLKECAARSDLIACLVRYDQGTGGASLRPKEGMTRSDRGAALRIITLSGHEAQTEPLEIAAHHLLHMVTLFL